MMSEFLTGIIAGVIASALFAALAIFVKMVIIPRIQDLFYDGPILTGEWQVFYSDEPNTQSAGKLEIKHIGRRLWGNARIWGNRTGEDVD